MGGDRAPRLRRPADRVRRARAARREHGVPARRVRRVPGLFDPKTGRKAGTLLGQEVREWCIRARAAGVRGMLRPGAWPFATSSRRRRLNKKYFRRWFYWRGISRAMLYDAVRARHGSAGADRRSTPAASRTSARRAALPVSQGAGARRVAARGPCCAATPSRHSSTNCGCGSLRASSGSAGPTAMPGRRRCGPATFLSPLIMERRSALRRLTSIAHQLDHAVARTRRVHDVSSSKRERRSIWRCSVPLPISSPHGPT